MAAPGLAAARGVAPDDERLAALLEVAGIGIGLGDFPPAREADAVGMEQPPEAALVWTPAEVRMRVHRAGDGLAELVLPPKWEESAQHAFESHLIRRYAPVAVKDSRIGIAEHRVAHFGEARSRVRPIGVDDLFDPKRRWCHHGATPITCPIAATRRSTLGSACGRTLPLGVGTGAVPTRITGARNRPELASATAATISAPTPPVTHASWTVTNRPVRRTDSTTVNVSSGCIERRSTTSTSIPSEARSSAARSPALTMEPMATSVTS